MTRRVADRLQDIHTAIQRARAADKELSRAAAAGSDTAVEISFDAILLNIFVIGEATKSLPEHVKNLEPQIPWADIARMRDLIGHHYHVINPQIIHNSVRKDLDPLNNAVERLLEKFK